MTFLHTHVAASALFGLMLLAPHAWAQEGTPATEPKSDLKNSGQAETITTGWSMQCRSGAESALACSISNSMMLRSNQQRFFAVTLSGGKDGQTLVSVAAPHGVDLEKAIFIKLSDDKTVPFAPYSSDATGLFARAVLDAEFVTALQVQKNMSFAFQGLDGNAYNVSFDTAGLAPLVTAAGLLPP